MEHMQISPYWALLDMRKKSKNFKQKVKNSDYSLKVIDEIYSPINGILLVTKNPSLGINIITPQKIAQSGTIMERSWDTALKKIKKQKIKDVLVLGYGGGSVARCIHKLWPKSKLTGVDIDPIIVKLGKKYLKQKSNNDEIIISDVFDYEPQGLFDLILIDLFIGSEIPEGLKSYDYLSHLVNNHLHHKGYLIINLINLPTSKDGVKEVSSVLKKIFVSVSRVKHQKNILIICSNQ
jgi:spermidine synthase